MGSQSELKRAESTPYRNISTRNSACTIPAISVLILTCGPNGVSALKHRKIRIAGKHGSHHACVEVVVGQQRMCLESIKVYANLCLIMIADLEIRIAENPFWMMSATVVSQVFTSWHVAVGISFHRLSSKQLNVTNIARPLKLTRLCQKG
jgi:hypothetical protein